jgi:hypothetical protein
VAPDRAEPLHVLTPIDLAAARADDATRSEQRMGGVGAPLELVDAES